MRGAWRITLAVAVGLALIVPMTLTGAARGDEVTISQDPGRTGWDPNEPGLAPGTVHGSSFGQLFATPVTGQVYAQPIVVGNTVVVATETDDVYGMNAQTGAIAWHTNLGPSWPSSVIGCGDLTPSIGVTSTPVYDASNGEVYLAAVVNNGKSLYEPNVYLFALTASTGQIDWQAPMQGAPVNDPTAPFDPLTERQRASLLLMNGEVYMGFSSYCDFPPYRGLVAGVNTSTHAVTMWTPEAGLTDNQGGIWHGGGGVMSDGPNRLFVTSGNGVSPPSSAGNKPPPQLGDATIQLGTQPDGSMVAQDYFSPVNAPQLDSADQDFGSGGPVALPFGTTADPHLLVQAGKDGRIFILNRDSLGGRGTTTDHPVTTNGPYPGQWGHPAAFAGAGGQDYIYYLGHNDVLRALKFNTSTAKLTDAFNSAVSFPYGSGSPVVTSNGSDPSSAVVWVVDHNGSGSTLDAFSAVPSSGNSLTPLWSAPIGATTKFTVPATDSGRVYVGTAGEVYGFGSPDAAPLTGSVPSFGQVPVGSSPSQTVTVTAQSTVTVTGVSTTSSAATDPFTAGTPNGPGGPVTFPVTLQQGQQLTVPVTFAPTAPGGVTGSLSLATNTANFSTVSVPLSGTGTQTGFYASPSTIAFGVEPIGAGITMQTVITNGGTANETWSPIAAPSDSAFTVSAQPSAGTQITPGQSVTLNVTYKPTGTSGDSSSISEPSSLSGGTAATVTLTGTGVAGQGTLTASPASVSFGSVALGQQASQTVDITNTGNLPVTITGFSAPTVPFGTPVPVQNGISLSPGSDIVLPITFTPQSKTTTTGSYTLTMTDGQNPPQTLTIGVSGTGVAPTSGVSIPSPGGGWTLNGTAVMTGTTLRLTKAATSQKGTAVYYQPMSSNGLQARFTTHMGGGSGADGLAFGMLDASKSTVKSMGSGGGQLGFGGLPGVGIALETYPKNLVGIATGASGGGLQFAATNTHIPNLRSGTHVVSVGVAGSAPATVTVKIDGTQYLSAQVNMPSQVLAAFTGATGGLDDLHSVSGVSVSSGAAVQPPGGGWSYNGSALLWGADTRLTQAVVGQDGSVVYPTAVPTNGLQVVYNMQIGGGTGADGMTFALLNPSAGATARGSGGSELGFGGLSGLAVAFDTHQVTGYPSSNFTGIATGVVKPGVLRFDKTINAIAPLRTGTHTVEVTVTGNVLSVYFDGALVLQRTETAMPAKALLAFTGSDGALSDLHAVRNVAISAP